MCGVKRGLIRSHERSSVRMKTMFGFVATGAAAWAGRSASATAAAATSTIATRLRMRERYTDYPVTVSVPCIPACRCPSTAQKNVYFPAFRLAVTVEVPPLPTISPAESSPPPSIAMLCERLDGFDIVIVTLPAGAVSEVLSNFSALLSAASLSEVAGPDAVAAGVDEDFLDPPPPQPARAAAMSTSVAVLRIVSSF